MLSVAQMKSDRAFIFNHKNRFERSFYLNIFGENAKNGVVSSDT
jgi:hypothetical protein